MRALLSCLVIFSALVAGLVLPGGAQAAVTDAQAVGASLAYLQAHAATWGIQNAAQELRVRGVVRDAIGQTHVRLDQVHQGVPVVGQQLVVHLDGNGAALSASGAFQAGIAASVQPVLSAAQARDAAVQRFPGALGTSPAIELVLYPQGGSVSLAYRVTLRDDATPRRILAFVDAASGQVIHGYSDLRTLLAGGAAPQALASGGAAAAATSIGGAATGTGNSLYSGAVSITTTQATRAFTLSDASRGGLRTGDMGNRPIGPAVIFRDSDNVWGNGTNNDAASAGVDAHFGAELTWDYYLSVHGRNGIRNDGVGPLSRVHYSRNYNNAFWDDGCFCMTYGDGNGVQFSPLVSLDVAGHEMTHGVTSATADLIYDNQSDGLNEAMSDIFGTMVEFFAAVHGAAKTPNYLIGEDVFTPNTAGDALRYMNNPTQDGNSIDTFADYNDNVDVHLSSGIANNAFYLLAEGGTHRLGGVVTGIGRSAAERIFYRALTVYMIPSETFSQARADTIKAATDLFGATSQEVASVGQAWTAVGVQ
jgi:Zn-dependent metalloprotease